MPINKGSLAALLLLSVSVLPEAPASGDIEKVGFPSQQALHLLWWPRMTVENGWHHERESSVANAINIFVPDGTPFSNAESVIYARAIYKPRDPDVTSIDVLVNQDSAGAARHTPGVQISDASAVKIADGTELRSLTFFPPREGNWERTAYGEDGDYYILFVVSARTKQAFDAAEPVYLKMVRSYTREPNQ